MDKIIKRNLLSLMLVLGFGLVADSMASDPKREDALQKLQQSGYSNVRLSSTNCEGYSFTAVKVNPVHGTICNNHIKAVNYLPADPLKL